MCLKLIGHSMMLRAKIWKYDGAAAWYFVSSSKEEGEHIRIHQKAVRGWRSVPVEVTLGTSTWRTSFFPVKDGSYLLPIKASVRKKEGILEGDVLEISVEFR